MPKIHHEKFKKPRTGFKIGMGIRYTEPVPILANLQGRLFVKMWDAKTGEIQLEREIKNVVTLDAGLLVARLMKDNQELTDAVKILREPSKAAQRD